MTKILGISEDGELFEGYDSPLEDNMNILPKIDKIEILNTLIKRCEKEKLKLLKND